MTEEAIRVDGVGKAYRLFDSKRDRIKEALDPLRRKFHREYWALKSVSFSVPAGQCIGILGRNGSGKSTLLQLIAGVLRPTEGRVATAGRIAALLELGAGFNPELTGRENVLLSGAILGVDHGEMQRRLPEIEAFADIGTFFDQPVRVYSSGMFVRVAFASAITVSPDILIVDEALAVGDAKFQNKCFEKILTFRREGKTVLFVTHNADLVTKLCDRGLVFESGRKDFDGDPRDAVDRYFELMFSGEVDARLRERGSTNVVRITAPGAGESRQRRESGDSLWDLNAREDVAFKRNAYNRQERRFGDKRASIIDFLLETDDGSDVACIRTGLSIRLYVKVLFCADVNRPVIGFSIKTRDGLEVYGTNSGSALLCRILPGAEAESVAVYCISFKQNLGPGDYFVDIGVGEENGTTPADVIEVRRSVCHLVNTTQERPTFLGVTDLSAAVELVQSTQNGSSPRNSTQREDRCQTTN